MEQRVSIITLGVKDIARSRRFYEVDAVVGFPLDHNGNLTVPPLDSPATTVSKDPSS